MRRQRHGMGMSGGPYVRWQFICWLSFYLNHLLKCCNFMKSGPHLPHYLSPGICDSHLGEFCQVLCLNHSSTAINQSEKRNMNGSPVVLWGLLGLLLHAATLTHNYILTLIVDFTLVMSAWALLLTFWVMGETRVRKIRYVCVFCKIFASCVLWWGEGPERGVRGSKIGNGKK